MKSSAKLVASATAAVAIITAVIWMSKPDTALDVSVLDEKVSRERPVDTASEEPGRYERGESDNAALTVTTESPPKTFEQIKAEAERGSAAAQRQLSDIYGYCMAYSLNPTIQLQTLDHLATVVPDSKASIDKVKARLVARCDRVDSGQPIPLEAVNLWAAQAATGGDVAAQVRLRVASMNPLTGEELGPLADASLAARDPEAMMEMSNLMSRPVEGEVPDRYKAVSGNSLAGAAWGIAACRTGAACGNGSIMMDSVCINTGKCNYRSYEDFVFAEMVPPAERQRVATMVQAILRLGQP